MKKYISDGTWFDKYSICRLIDDYRPAMNSGLFIGFHKGKIDQEVCNFNEFIEFDAEKTDSEVDKAYAFQDTWWKERDAQNVGAIHKTIVNYKEE